MVNHHPHGNAYRKTRPGFTLTSDKYNLMFMRKMILKEDDNICRRAVMNKTILGAK